MPQCCHFAVISFQKTSYGLHFGSTPGHFAYKTRLILALLRTLCFPCGTPFDLRFVPEWLPFGPACALLGASWSHLESILRLLGAILAPPGLILVLLVAHVSLSRAILEPSWPFLAHLGAI